MSRLLCYATKNFLYFEMKYLRNVHCEYTKKNLLLVIILIIMTFFAFLSLHFIYFHMIIYIYYPLEVWLLWWKKSMSLCIEHAWHCWLSHGWRTCSSSLWSFSSAFDAEQKRHIIRSRSDQVILLCMLTYDRCCTHMTNTKYINSMEQHYSWIKVVKK